MKAGYMGGNFLMWTDDEGNIKPVGLSFIIEPLPKVIYLQ